MQIKDKVVIVTGGANGIGRAMCRRFAAEGARAVVVADLDSTGATTVAEEINGIPFNINVSSEAFKKRLVDETLNSFGHIDLFCANAGITGERGGHEVSSDSWQQIWDVNVMSHIHAVKAVLPSMLKRGSGYLLHTASAAGLLTHVEGAPYSVTKHAVVAFAEWLSITHGDEGIGVSCLCPLGVRTRMLFGVEGERTSFLMNGAIEPEVVADVVMSGLAEETFLILPHPEVAMFFNRKASDYDRWIRGMRKLSKEVMGQANSEDQT
jgi:NAD(P)-dependent dehydrogenase (short-subunit alcohol dehydrogenase family)